MQSTRSVLTRFFRIAHWLGWLCALLFGWSQCNDIASPVFFLLHSAALRLSVSHLGLEIEEFFQALVVVLEAAADVDALEGLVVENLEGCCSHIRRR